MIKLWMLSLASGIAAVTFAVVALPREIAPAPPPSPGSFAPSVVERGEMLATVGNCVGCHTAEGGHRLAGGRRLWTPFGNIASRNITPELATGIGSWSEAAFRRAMREGIARDGSQLFPACPFDHFTKLAEADLVAIYAYLMSGPAVRSPPSINHTILPLGVRSFQPIWRAIYLSQGFQRAEGAKSEEWNRGAYLVEGLAACGSCHTPRNILGAEQVGHPLAGEKMFPWLAPSLDLSPSPMRWTRADLQTYLRGGSSPQGRAVGPMAEIAENLRKLSSSDLDAVTTYLLSFNRPQSGSPDRDVAHALAHATRDGDPEHDRGRRIFTRHCASCHDAAMSSTGRPEDLSLKSALWDQEPHNLISIVLLGVRPAASRGSMPAFRDVLGEDDLSLWPRTCVAYAPIARPGHCWPSGRVSYGRPFCSSRRDETAANRRRHQNGPRKRRSWLKKSSLPRSACSRPSIISTSRTMVLALG